MNISIFLEIGKSFGFVQRSLFICECHADYLCVDHFCIESAYFKTLSSIPSINDVMVQVVVAVKIKALGRGWYALWSVIPPKNHELFANFSSFV